MPIISDIKPARRPHRFHVYLDGEYFASVGEKVIADLGIRIGQEIGSELLTQMVEVEETRRAMESASRLLATRTRSSQEIVNRLREKGYEPPIIERVINRLKEVGLIDDTVFAQEWVDSRSRVRPKGARMLRAELAQKGVAREIVDNTLEEIDHDKELALAKSAISSKLKRGKLPDDPGQRQAEYRKLVSFLQRRGFGWDIIKTALKESLGQDELLDAED